MEKWVFFPHNFLEFDPAYQVPAIGRAVVSVTHTDTENPVSQLYFPCNFNTKRGPQLCAMTHANQAIQLSAVFRKSIRVSVSVWEFVATSEIDKIKG